MHLASQPFHFHSIASFYNCWHSGYFKTSTFSSYLDPNLRVCVSEFRTIIEPVRTLTGLHYLQAECTDVDAQKQVLTCQTTYEEKPLSIGYDFLVCMCSIKTFPRS